MTTGVIIIAIIGLLVALVYRNIRARNTRSKIIAAVNNHTPKPDLPISFGYKNSWFAIKTTNYQRITDIFKIKNVTPCNWKEGIAKAYAYPGNSIFVTPPIEGWTLVCGFVLPDGGTKESINDVKNILQALSKGFNDAQFFSTHRVVELQCWAKAIDGKITRVYSWLGEQGKNIAVEGEPTELERNYKLPNTFSGEIDFDDKDLFLPHEDFVMKIAGNWSLDPSQLSNREDLQPGLGIVGQH